MSVSHSHVEHAHPEMSFIRKYIFSTDHKIIGIQFLFSSVIFLMVGASLWLARGQVSARGGCAWCHDVRDWNSPASANSSGTDLRFSSATCTTQEE